MVSVNASFISSVGFNVSSLGGASKNEGKEAASIQTVIVDNADATYTISRGNTTRFQLRLQGADSCIYGGEYGQERLVVVTYDVDPFAPRQSVPGFHFDRITSTPRGIVTGFNLQVDRNVQPGVYQIKFSCNTSDSYVTIRVQ